MPPPEGAAEGALPTLRFDALITELAHHAMLCLDGHSVAEREYMLQLRKRLAALVAAVCRPPPPRLCSNSEARAAQ